MTIEFSVNFFRYYLSFVNKRYVKVEIAFLTIELYDNENDITFSRSILSYDRFHNNIIIDILYFQFLFKLKR